MSPHKANQLTLGGFSALYVGCMGTLLAVNAPVIVDFRKPVVLFLSAIALAGLAVMLVGRLAKVDENSD
jgi:hypothetical protein